MSAVPKPGQRLERRDRRSAERGGAPSFVDADTAVPDGGATLESTVDDRRPRVRAPSAPTAETTHPEGELTPIGAGLEDTVPPEAGWGPSPLGAAAVGSFDQVETVAGAMAVASMPRPAAASDDGRTFGLYRTLDVLGAGAFATVYRATHTARGGEYALKLLRPDLSRDPDIVAGFEREARALLRIRNPHIVALLDFGVTPDGAFFLVTELVAGERLSELLAREAPLPTGRVIELASQVARALAAAHAEGFVHRDLKPDNVMIAPSGAKVLDFGLAILAGAPEGRGFVGTPGFVAPEVIAGGRAGPEADLYALGMLIHEMAVGAPPFRGELAELLFAHTTRALDLPEALGPLRPLVGALAAKDPAERPTGARAVAAELDRLARAAGAPTIPPDPASGIAVAHTDPEARRTRALFLLALGLFALAGWIWLG